MSDGSNGRRSPHYQAIERILSQSISQGRLSSGLVLMEDPLARLFGTSRTPVRKALGELTAKGVVTRSGGRGFVVGRDAGATPRRTAITAEMLGLNVEGTAEPPRGEAERIAEAFEAEIANALPFGLYRVNEVAAAEHYRVSRTIIRELLQRFQDRGLVRKDRRSHWVVGPLTARDLAHYFDIRGKLEPLALVGSAPRIPPEEIKAAFERTRAGIACGDALTSARVESLELDIHRGLLSRTPNRHLLRIIEQSQIALVVNRLFSASVGGRPFMVALEEHAIVLEFIIRGSYAAAASALEEHLRLSAARTHKRLMAMSVFPTPLMPDFLRQERR